MSRESLFACIWGKFIADFCLNDGMKLITGKMGEDYKVEIMQIWIFVEIYGRWWDSLVLLLILRAMR